MTQVLQVDPIQIFYPNGGTSASQMYVWDGSKPVLWDGSVTFSGSITIGAVTGNLTNNGQAPPASQQLGVLPAVANAVAPTLTEGRQVLLSTDLSGALRVSATIDTSLIATSANQTNGNQLVKGTGTAGTASTGVLTVQGIASMTPVQVTINSGSAVIGHVITDTGSTTAVTGNVTVVQGTGTNLHAVLDSGSTTIATQATAANLNATVVGTGTFAVQATISAGSAVIGHVITDSGSVTSAVLTTGSAQIGHLEANQSVNLAQVAGSSTATGHGTASGSVRVELPTDGTGVIAGVTTVTTVAAVTAITNALPAGTNTIGAVNVKPTTAGGLLVKMCTSADGSTALTNSAQAIKASAGQLYGWYIYNPNSAATYVSIYNVAAASVTVGTTNPYMSLCIPATSAANVEFTNGIEFTNAGWSAAATTTGGGASAPSSALEANFMYL